MERKLDDLNKEILVLNERISALEAKEHRRSIWKSIKLLFGIILFLGAFLLIYKAYDYVTNYVPNYIEDKVNNLNIFDNNKNNENNR